MKELTKANVTVGELWDSLLPDDPYDGPEKDMLAANDPTMPIWETCFPNLKAAYDKLPEGK